MIISLITFSLIIDVSYSYFIPPFENSNKTLLNFAFGSCFKGFMSRSNRHDIFQIINDYNPELWLWLGDVAYLDYSTLHYYKHTINLNLTESKRRFDESKNDKCNFYYFFIE